MPLYTFQNPKTGKIKTIIQRMAEDHVYYEKGVKWDRLYEAP